MSLSSSISIKLSINVDTNRLFKLMTEPPFSLFDSRNLVGYVAIGEEYGDWIEEKISANELLHILSTKLRYNERAAFLTHLEDSRGIIFSWISDSREASFSLETNRMTLAGTKFTDFSWYLEKLVGVLESICDILVIECRDVH